MSTRRALRLVPFALAILFLLAVAWLTLTGAVDQLPRARSTGQRIETWVQLAAGILSLLVVLTRFRWRRYARGARLAWAAALAAVAGLSPLVWGPPMPRLGLLFAALALLVGLAVDRALRPRP